MLELEVLVGELHAVDGLAPRAVVLGEVSRLTPSAKGRARIDLTTTRAQQRS